MFPPWPHLEKASNMAGTSSVALVVPGCTVQVGRPWLSENETCCAIACEIIDNGSSLAIESRDMLGDELVGQAQSPCLRKVVWTKKCLLWFHALSLYSRSRLTAISPHWHRPCCGDDLLGNGPWPVRRICGRDEDIKGFPSRVRARKQVSRHLIPAL